MNFKIFAIAGLTLLVAFGLFGAIPAFNVSASTGSCTVAWNDPSGTYALGDTVTATSQPQCQGTGSWQICTSSISQCILGVGIVQSGTFSCPAGGCSSALTLFTDTVSQTVGVNPSGCSSTCNIGPGSYSYVAGFTGAQSTQNAFTASTAVFTPQFPVGIILAVLAPIGALIGYAKFGKPAIRNPA